MDRIVLPAERQETEHHCEVHGAYTAFWVASLQKWSPCPKCALQQQRQQRASPPPQRPLLRLDERYAHATLADMQACAHAGATQDERAVYARLLKYVQRAAVVRERGTWALLAGTHGSGKTHAMVALARALYDQGFSVAWLRCSDIIDRALHARQGDYRRPLPMQADFWFVDECSAQQGEHSAFFEIIDARYRARLPVMFAGNAPVARDSDLDVARCVLGDRIADRLFDGGGAVLRFTWGSRRQQAAEPVF
jgi:DNA replication protein DnaC